MTTPVIPTSSSIMAQVRDILYADADIIAWCQGKYADGPYVWLGMDDRNLPDSTQYPLIAVLSVTQIRGADAHQLKWDVEINCVIHNDNISVTGRQSTCDGLLDVETLRELAENALYKARFATITSDGLSMTISDFPLFESITKIRISVPASFRSGISKRLSS